jgi:hypothetical protein
MTVWSTSIDGVWARVFTVLSEPGCDKLLPLRVSIRGPWPVALTDDTELTRAINKCCNSMGLASISTVANTIFPQVLWNLSRPNRVVLFDMYRRNLGWIQNQAPANRNGTYFGRLIQPHARKPQGQLEYIISTYRKNAAAVTMRLQAGIYDPGRDNVGARPGFPCMQQVSFAVNAGCLSANAFYATQQALSKAYGNYLGLVRLGEFMANQMEIALKSVEIHIGVAHIEGRGRYRTSSEYAILRNMAAELISNDVAGGSIED